MTERLPNGSDGWVPPPEPPTLTDAEILFLWHERCRDGRITYWTDSDGVFHFVTNCHPGCALPPKTLGYDHQGMPV